MPTQGTLDTTFNNTGTVVTDFVSNGESKAYSVTIDQNNNIIVAGYVYINGSVDYALARYLPNGTLDTTFNTTGIVVTDFVSNGDWHSIANSVTIDQNNNIIVAGYVEINGSVDYALARYLPTGVLDTTFNNTGTVVTDFVSNGESQANSVTIDQNNNIIVAGYVYNINGEDYALARYLPTGVLDTTFNNTGTVVTDFVSNGESQANSVTIDQNNNIIVAGYVEINGSADYALARYLPTGVLDTTFNNTGTVVTDFVSNGESQANSVTIDQNNNIIVAGINGSMYISVDYALARYLPTGVLDTTFNNTGTVVTDFVSNGDSKAYSVTIDQNNNIIVAGYVYINGSVDYALARYLPTGVLDTTFNNTGTVVTDFVSNGDSRAYSVTIDQNNNIIVAGYVYINGEDYALARYYNGLPPAPTITNISPGLGPAGTTVIITGTNLSGATSVTFGGVAATGISISQTGVITCTAPAHALGTVDVIVTASGGPVTSTNAFTYTVAPVSNICFPAGIPITCNQGDIPIEQLNPEIHTIRGKKIVCITKTITQDKYLVCFEKDALQENIPSQKTVISKNHGIFYKGEMMQAKGFINDFANVKKVKYTGEVLYNVLMEQPDKMMVNNLICETLHPENTVAQLYKALSHLNTEEQNEVITKFNQCVIKNNIYNKKIEKR